jgi:hypothetical protein
VFATGSMNRATEFDWDAVYGGGFDVVNFVTTSTGQLVLGCDSYTGSVFELSLAPSFSWSVTNRYRMPLSPRQRRTYGQVWIHYVGAISCQPLTGFWNTGASTVPPIQVAGASVPKTGQWLTRNCPHVMNPHLAVRSQQIG